MHGAGMTEASLELGTRLRNTNQSRSFFRHSILKRILLRLSVAEISQSGWIKTKTSSFGETGSTWVQLRTKNLVSNLKMLRNLKESWLLRTLRTFTVATRMRLSYRTATSNLLANSQKMLMKATGLERRALTIVNSSHNKKRITQARLIAGN